MGSEEILSTECRFAVKFPKPVLPPLFGQGEHHPFSPPFPAGEFNFGRLDSFNRGAITPFDYVVFVGGGDVIRTFRTLSHARRRSDESRRVYFCETAETEKLDDLHDRLPENRTVLVVLSSKFDEMELLALSLAYPAWSRVFLAPTHGSLAEGARLLRIPFFPIDLNFSRFWHDSELFYLPLASLGFKPEAVNEGLIQGYRQCLKGCRELAARLRQMEKDGCRWVFFVSRNPFYRAVLESVIPLLEESSLDGNNRITYRPVSPDTLKEYYLEEAYRNPAGYCFLWMDEQYHSAGPKVNIPETMVENLYLDRRFFHLQGKPISVLSFSETRSLFRYLQECGSEMVLLSGFLEEECSMGGLLAVSHLLACYNAWLRGIDLFNDPARVEADGMIWESIGGEEELARENS